MRYKWNTRTHDMRQTENNSNFLLNAWHIESSTIKRCGLVGVGVALWKEVCHCGGGLKLCYIRVEVYMLTRKFSFLQSRFKVNVEIKTQNIRREKHHYFTGSTEHFWELDC